MAELIHGDPLGLFKEVRALVVVMYVHEGLVLSFGALCSHLARSEAKPIQVATSRHVWIKSRQLDEA